MITIIVVMVVSGGRVGVGVGWGGVGGCDDKSSDVVLGERGLWVDGVKVPLVGVGMSGGCDNDQ